MMFKLECCVLTQKIDGLNQCCIERCVLYIVVTLFCSLPFVLTDTYRHQMCIIHFMSLCLLQSCDVCKPKYQLLLPDSIYYSILMSFEYFEKDIV